MGLLEEDEKEFDSLLVRAMEHQKCQKCGHEIGREEMKEDIRNQAGVLFFKKLRFRRLCSTCHGRGF